MPRIARRSYFVGSTSTISLVEESFAEITNNVDRNDTTGGVSKEKCSDCMGFEDDKGDVDFAPSPNGISAGLGNMNYMVLDVWPAGPV